MQHRDRCWAFYFYIHSVHSEGGGCHDYGFCVFPLSFSVFLLLGSVLLIHSC